VTDGQPGNSI